MQDSLLRLVGIYKYFGGLCAISNLDFTVQEESIKAIIGPNGAGKTTLFNLITGILRADQGSIVYNEREIINFLPHEIARLGISRTFQNVETFQNMTVLENVMVGRHVRTKAGMLSSVLRLKTMKKEEARISKDALGLLAFVGLVDRSNQTSSELPMGEQRLLEIARALATEPRILLLDEPASGLNESEIETLSSLITKIRDERRITVILVEHVMKLVMKIAEDILVLNFGSKIAEGPPEMIRNNESVIEAYLGDSQK